MNIGYRASIACAMTIDRLTDIILHREGFVSKNKIDFLALNHSSDITKAKIELNYCPRYDCESGLQLTMRWYDERGLI